MNMKGVKEAVRQFSHFMREDVWDVELSVLSPLRAAWFRTIRVGWIVLRGFRQDQCPLHAASLTFSTLMAVVPILAFSLAVARGLGGAETAKTRIREAVADWTRRFEAGAADARGVPGETEIAAGPAEPAAEDDALHLAAQINDLVDQAFEKVENINFTGLGALGLVLLLWMVISVLGRVENAFNRVWGVTVGRPVLRKVTDYLSVLFILPLLALAATSMPVADFATRFLSGPAAMRVSGILASGALKQFTVLAMTTLCFTFMIMFMPNTQVRARAGLTGGLLTALLFIGWLAACAALQVGVARMGRIYGSFAVVPILITWVYVSWQIVLFGAEVAFAVQNCATYRLEEGARQASVRGRMMLALSVMAEAARAMAEGDRGFEASSFAARKRVPVRLLNAVLDELVRSNLLAELSGTRGRFVLLRAPGDLTVKEVVDAMLGTGREPAVSGLRSEDPRIEAVLKKAEQGIGQSLDRVTIAELLREEG